MLRARVIIRAVIGLAWVGFTALPSRGSAGSELWLLASGFAAAVYAGVIYAARPESLRTTAELMLVVLTGVFHVAWLLLSGIPVMWVLRSAANDGVVMIAITGFGYALVLGVACRSWKCTVAMGLGTVAATYAPWAHNVSGFPIGIALLHLSIVLVLTGATWRAIDTQRPAYLCAHCGYDLRGIGDRVCPECGCPRQAPAT